MTDAVSAASLPPSALLDPTETNPQETEPLGAAPVIDDDNEPGIRFRHSGWAGVRRKVQAALVLAQASPSRIARFAGCGADAWVYEHSDSPGSYFVAGSCCKDKLCHPCASARAAAVSASLRKAMGATPCRFLTLTLRDDGQTLSARIDRLYAAFQLLRRQQMWRDCVLGGAAFLEVTRGKSGTHWHTHLHCVITGKFMHQPELSKLWLRCTGDSSIVDIRAIADTAQAADYVSKYAGKTPLRRVGHDVRLIAEVIVAYSGRRTCFTFGDWRGKLLSEKDDSKTGTPVASLRTLMQQAQAGNAAAEAVLLSLREPQNWSASCTKTDRANTKPP